MIVIVDDDRVITELTKEFLLENNYSAEGFNCGNAAINWFSQNHSCDLLITDLHMKNGSGYELLTWMKHNKPEVQTLVITGKLQVQLDEIRGTSCLDGIPVLSKPFTGDKLLSTIKIL